MAVKINADFEGLIKDFDDLKRHIRRNAEFGAEKALKISIKNLQATLFDIINNQIRLADQAPKTPQSGAEPLPEKMNIPKSKADLVKHIFGEDLKNADYYQSSLGNKTVNDNSNVFVVKDGRIKAWQNVNDGSTYEGDENRFRQRLMTGIIIDADTGKMFKLDPNTVKGIKLECSRDTGQTIDSDKKYQAYKSSDKMNRQKNGDPAQRLAVWTIRQEDVRNMMNSAVSVDEIVKRVLEEDYDTAKKLLGSINKDGSLDETIQKVEDLRTNTNVPTDVRAIQDIQKLIRNLKIEKQKTSKDTTRYILFTTYDETADHNVKFMEQLQTQVQLWTFVEQEGWYKSIVDQVVQALAKYDRKAKII